MAIDVQKEMYRRVANGLNDLHHELLAEGLDVQFDVKETAGGLTVKFAVVGGKVAPNVPLVIEDEPLPDDGEETVLLNPKKRGG